MIRRHSCKGWGAVLPGLLGLAISAQSLAGTVTTDGADIVIKTRAASKSPPRDKNSSFKLRRPPANDYGRFDGYCTNNGNYRRCRLFRACLGFGARYRGWKYQIDYDLSRNVGNDSAGYFDEASVTYAGFNPVNLKFGRFYTDFGLEEATSSKWVTALERNLTYDIADWVNDSDRYRYQASSVVGGMASSRAACSARTTTIPTATASSATTCAACSRRCTRPGDVVHLGLQYAYRDLEDSAVDTRIRPRMGTRGVSTNGGNDAGSNGNRGLFGGSSASRGLWKDDSVWGLEGAWALVPSGPGRVPAAHGQGRARPREISRPPAITRSWPTPSPASRASTSWTAPSSTPSSRRTRKSAPGSCSTATTRSRSRMTTSSSTAPPARSATPGQDRIPWASTGTPTRR